MHIKMGIIFFLLKCGLVCCLLIKMGVEFEETGVFLRLACERKQL